MTLAPSVSYSITVRLEVASRGRAVSEITGLWNTAAAS